MFDKLRLFDSHFHIIDKQYPLLSNSGYIPAEFTCNDYLRKTSNYDLCGGVIVSGSFQAFDQSYLIDALGKMGSSFVGITQLPQNVKDIEIMSLHEHGVRGVRFNLHRGGSENIAHLSAMAERIHALAGWHVELYVDSRDLGNLYQLLIDLPMVVIDHLGLSKAGFKLLTRLAEKGVKVKASGFGRVDFDVKPALTDLYSANPKSLMFGTDMPSTRAPRPYSDSDLSLVVQALGWVGAQDVLSGNAIELYKPKEPLIYS